MTPTESMTVSMTRAEWTRALFVLSIVFGAVLGAGWRN